jgi:hypothetical protein
VDVVCECLKHIFEQRTVILYIRLASGAVHLKHAQPRMDYAISVLEKVNTLVVGGEVISMISKRRFEMLKQHWNLDKIYSSLKEQHMHYIIQRQIRKKIKIVFSFELESKLQQSLYDTYFSLFKKF